MNYPNDIMYIIYSFLMPHSKSVLDNIKMICMLSNGWTLSNWYAPYWPNINHNRVLKLFKLINTPTRSYKYIKKEFGNLHLFVNLRLFIYSRYFKHVVYQTYFADIYNKRKDFQDPFMYRSVMDDIRYSIKNKHSSVIKKIWNWVTKIYYNNI